MARTKGASGRAQEDTVQNLRNWARLVADKAQQDGCRACTEKRDLVAVPLQGHGDLPGFSRLPYQKGMTLAELKDQALLYRWICRKCLKGVMYPPEWADKKKGQAPREIEVEEHDLVWDLIRGDCEELSYEGTVLWRRVGRIAE